MLIKDFVCDSGTHLSPASYSDYCCSESVFRCINPIYPILEFNTYSYPIVQILYPINREPVTELPLWDSKSYTAPPHPAVSSVLVEV